MISSPGLSASGWQGIFARSCTGLPGTQRATKTSSPIIQLDLTHTLKCGNGTKLKDTRAESLRLLDYIAGHVRGGLALFIIMSRCATDLHNFH